MESGLVSWILLICIKNNIHNDKLKVYQTVSNTDIYMLERFSFKMIATIILKPLIHQEINQSLNRNCLAP